MAKNKLLELGKKDENVTKKNTRVYSCLYDKYDYKIERKKVKKYNFKINYYYLIKTHEITNVDF